MSTELDRPVKVALLLPDGVGVRNFLLGSFRDTARPRLSLAIFHTLSEELRRDYDADAGDGAVEWHPFLNVGETPAFFMLRNIHGYAHQYAVDTWAMRCLRELPIGGRFKRRLAAESARLLGRLAGTPRRVRWLDRRLGALAARLPETERYRRLLAEIRPDVLLSSNQRPYTMLPPVLAAQSLGIPTASCIFSWDNLTSKGRIAAPFDHFFAWSPLMRDELLKIYPEISADRVHIVGTPQFDTYTDARMVWTREEFFARIGADPARPLICYSSGDAGNSPEDQDHTALLLDLIRQGRIKGNPQVLLRPTPASDARRFAEVSRRFPELIYAKPEWIFAKNGDWAQAFPTAADVQFLANLTRHADLNVNVASTMTLDFAIHDRPVVNVAFDVAQPGPFKFPLWDYYYQFEHYKPVVAAGAALFSRSVDEFVEHVNAYLDNPRLHAENRRRLVELELGVAVGGASQRMVDALTMIGASHSPARHAAGAAAPALLPFRQSTITQPGQ
jgi:hypothetical protein